MSARTAVMIGNFDGAHLGHVALVERARRAAGGRGRVVALVFDPHPLSVIAPDAVPARLSLLEQRRAWLRAAGATEVRRLEPTRELLGRTPEAFVADLVERERPDAIVEGPDFRFGRGRAGTVETLARLGRTHGFETLVIDPVEVGLTDRSVVVASSTMIRWLLARGRVEDAARLLGRPHELTGTVVRGDQRGRELSCPTANVDCGDLLLPADGIYAGTALAPGGEPWPAAISVGTKPTFGGTARACEAHLVGWDGPLDRYGWTTTVRVEHWLRDQVAYDGVDALAAQIGRDCARVLELCGPRTVPA